jgi:hypothetical protein
MSKYPLVKDAYLIGSYPALAKSGVAMFGMLY